MRRLIIATIILIGLIALIIGSVLAKTEDPEKGTVLEIEQALQQAVGQNLERSLAYVVYETGIDTVRVSSDGWAVLWLAAIDRDTGSPIGMEPGLGIGRLVDDKWVVYLPTDPEFLPSLNLLPSEILPEAERTYWVDQVQLDCDTSTIGPFSGYRLPWEAGRTLFLTQSIYHTLGWGYNPSNSMIHSFDFSTSPSALFDVSAAKGGTVKYIRDVQPNGDDTSPGNYIVLEDTSTTPTSYMLYLHLAQGSIPTNIKLTGTEVQQGQFIGVADDTGASTNHHLHFQVHTDVSWWGCSVDVLFSDVPINNGRPRRVVEAQNYPEYGSQGQDTYTSGNIPPTSNPNNLDVLVETPGIGQQITQTLVTLEGLVFDPTYDISATQFTLNFGSGWQTAGPVIQNPSQANGLASIESSIDLCSMNVPVGPVLIGINALNSVGQSIENGGAVAVVNSSSCFTPPPSCSPAANQVAVFESPDFQGNCQVLELGIHIESYPISSVMVGPDAAVTIYKEASGLTGRSQTFTEDNANLADDWSGNDDFQAVIVTLKTQKPGIPRPTWPDQGLSISEGNVSLLWDDGGGGVEFQARISGPAQPITSSWMTSVDWRPNLQSGSYSWDVRARNDAGVSDWSALRVFTVTAVTLSETSVTVPYNESFDGGLNGWTATGLWNLLPSTPNVSYQEKSWWYGAPAGDFSNGGYDTGQPNTGSLTSPQIAIPATGNYYLRYYSMYETEQAGLQWDRRQVQVAVEGGDFVTLYQHEHDLMNGEEGFEWWVRAPYISLADFAGQAIRVRFIFDSVDKYNNDYSGWLIDSLTIDTGAPPTCTGVNEFDGDFVNATTITYGLTKNAELCPAGDLDFYKFTGVAGDRVSINVDAKSIGSPLDSYVVLYDTDGTSVLAENDDEIYGELQDPLLAYTLPRDGTYYLMLRRWNHPNFLYNTYTYTLNVDMDSVAPVINNISTSEPLLELITLPELVTLSADITDTGLGVSRVEFYYHTGTWSEEDWVLLGDDTDGTDGWLLEWDTGAHPAHEKMAFVVVAYDFAYNEAADGIWNLFSVRNLFFPAIFK